MQVTELRDAVVQGLYAYLGRPVVLSDQSVPEAGFPYVYYQMVAPFLPLGGASTVYTGGKHIKTEPTETTISFSACSADRGAGDTTIYGDDEALQLAERALGWFLHAGRDWLSERGVVVVEAYNVQNRTAVEVDEVARRYGFDVCLRYARSDEHAVPPIAGGIFKSL